MYYYSWGFNPQYRNHSFNPKNVKIELRNHSFKPKNAKNKFKNHSFNPKDVKINYKNQFYGKIKHKTYQCVFKSQS